MKYRKKRGGKSWHLKSNKILAYKQTTNHTWHFILPYFLDLTLPYHVNSIVYLKDEC